MNKQPTKMTHKPGDPPAAPPPVIISTIQVPNKTTHHHDIDIQNQHQLSSHESLSPAGNEEEEEEEEEEEGGAGAVIEDNMRSGPGQAAAVEVLTKDDIDATARVQQQAEDINGRERLTRHRIEVAGQVWIPDIWGQEEMLKDWIDCSAFDASLVPAGIMSARAALAQERRRANSGGLRIENRC